MNNRDRWVNAISAAFTVLILVIVFVVLLGGLVSGVRLILWGLGIL